MYGGWRQRELSRVVCSSVIPQEDGRSLGLLVKVQVYIRDGSSLLYVDCHMSSISGGAQRCASELQGQARLTTPKSQYRDRPEKVQEAGSRVPLICESCALLFRKIRYHQQTHILFNSKTAHAFAMIHGSTRAVQVNCTTSREAQR